MEDDARTEKIGKTPRKTPRPSGHKTPRPSGRKPARKKNHLFVVGIGASAGGLEALRPLVAKLPKTVPLAYVVVQHMAPQYKSMMVELLARETELPIVEIKNRARLTPNRIFVTPPNHDVEVRKGILYLRPPTNPVGPKPSIDNFFSSLAEDQGENAIGVILSGTGTDGALGIRAIKAHGGFAVVQDPKTAKYNGMPLASIETNLVDLTLPPDRIGAHIAEIVQVPGKAFELMQGQESGMSVLDEIFALVKKRTDIDFSQYKPATLCRRIERRMAATGADALDVYVEHMRKEPAEAESLCKDILISVTQFFRDRDVYDALTAVIDEIVSAKQSGDEIRLWVPGCATGEEPYTLAIMLAERLGVNRGNYKLQIFATDIDLEALERARKGIYLEAALRDMDPALVDKYFSKKGDKYHISKELRDIVNFARQDLAKDPPFVRLDLISCRNVLIYFNAQLQDRVFAAFHFALLPTGHMFLGKSEALGQNAELFVTVSTGGRIYKKKPTPGHRANYYSLLERNRPRLPVVGAEDSKKVSIEEAMRATLIRNYGPKAMMIGDDGTVYQISGDVTGYMVIATGKGDLNVTKMLIPELRGEFWALFARAKKGGESALGAIKRVKIGGASKGVRMAIHPSARIVGMAELFLLGFEEFEITDPPETGVADGVIETDVSRVPELEQELAATKEHLQTVIEELETSNEELQALNEELQASNEEMQSTNEELETSNEELQSTNEELTTVNEELQTRTTELLAANADLENMQRNVGFSLIILDPKMRIKRFTPAAVKYFGIAAEDLGESITSIPAHVEIKDLKRKLTGVMATGTPVEEEILTQKMVLWLRIVPYRMDDGRVDGAVIVIIDQTEVYEARQRSAHNERLLRLVSNALPMAVAHVDADQRVVTANDRFQRWFGRGDRPATGRKLVTALGRRLHGELSDPLAKAVAGEAVSGEWTIATPGDPENAQRIARITLVPLSAEDATGKGLVTILDDVTELNQTRDELGRAKERYRTLAEGTLQGIVIHRNGRPVYANHAFARMFGYDDPDGVTALRSLRSLLPPGDDGHEVSHSLLFGSGHAPNTVVAAGSRRDGSVGRYVVSSRVVEWEGTLAVQTATVDISAF